MRDTEGKLRWYLGSAGVLLLLLLAIGFAGSVGTSDLGATSDPTPTATPQLVTIDPALEAQRTIEAGLERIYAESVDRDDAAGQQRLVDDYRALKLIAQRNHAVIPSECAVAVRGYQVEKFLLAKDAWESCYLDGVVSGDNRQALGFYAASLRNLGYNWAVYGKDQQTRYKGQVYLVTCVEVVRRYNLNVGECQQDLVSIAGTDEARWVPAASSPLLLTH